MNHNHEILSSDQSEQRTHPDVRTEVVGLTIMLQVLLDLQMGQEAAQLGIKWEIREHHHLLGQVGSIRKSEELSRFADFCKEQRNDPLLT